MSRSSADVPMEIGKDDPKTTGTVPRDQIYATIFGQCIGDAVGIMVKYVDRYKAEQILKKNGIFDYNEASNDTCRIPWAAGDWTNNSDSMILMMQSLIDNGGKIIPQDFAGKLLHWLRNGFNELGDSSGFEDDKAYEQIMMYDLFTQQPHKVAEGAWKSNLVPAPNSCVTRTSILGIHEWWNTEHVVENVLNICKTTHFDPRCHATAVAIAVAISLMLQKDSKIYANGECQVRVLTDMVYKYAAKCLKTDKEKKQLKDGLCCTEISKLRLQEGGNDVFKILGAGFWALKQKDFREALVTILLCQGDANTNGAVAGALLGCKLGHQQYFPEDWRKFAHKEWLAGNIERFIAMLERYQLTHEEQAMWNMDMKNNKPQFDHLGNGSNTCRKSSLDFIKHLEPAVQKQIRATLYGQCIGDAIGLLTEFMTKKEAEQKYRKSLQLEYSHKYEDKHRARWEIGDWTDDSDQMFLIMQSLIDNEGEVIHFDFAERMVHWMKHGFKKCGDRGGLGIGRTTHSIVTNSKFTQDPYQAAQDEWISCGKNMAPNGGVMRTSVLGVHDWWETRKVKKNALDICLTTHRDPRCQASAVAVSVAISLMLQRAHYEGNELNVKKLISEVYEYASTCLETKDLKNELRNYLNCKDLHQLQLDEQDAIGYTYKCMGAGFWALKQTDFRKALTDIVMSGGDADTNGAVAGALLGCKLGCLTLFPPSWVELKHKDFLEDNLNRFLIMMDMRYKKYKEKIETLKDQAK